MLKGSFHATVESKNRITEAEMYVANGNSGSLLSYKTASELGLIKIKVDAVDVDERITVDKLAEDHPELFAGVEKLKKHQVKLHIDPTVQKMVEKEIDNLLEQDITSQ